MTPTTTACMVRAALLAHDAGAPWGVPLTIRRRESAVIGPFMARARVTRHVVEWDAGDDERGVVIADVLVPL